MALPAASRNAFGMSQMTALVSASTKKYSSSMPKLKCSPMVNLVSEAEEHRRESVTGTRNAAAWFLARGVDAHQGSDW
jgi:hypothetical protein